VNKRSCPLSQNKVAVVLQLVRWYHGVPSSLVTKGLFYTTRSLYLCGFATYAFFTNQVFIENGLKALS
jgi:hypothetical protein